MPGQSSTYLRRDHEDGDVYHLVHHHAGFVLGVSYVARYNACPLHIDMVRMLLGDRVAGAAVSLEMGDSMLIELSAQLPVQDRIDGAHASVLCDEDHSDDDTVLYADADKAVLEQTMGGAA